MPYVVRRTFYAKVGQSDPLAKHFKKGNKLFRQVGIKSRVATDFNSGRSDRVEVEWQVAELGQMEKAMADAMANPASRKQFTDWERKMNQMIDYSEAEVWSIR